MTFQILIIFALVLLNAVFAMAEMAVVAARKSRLEAQADAGGRNAKTILDLANEPAQLLSTVQIGMTLIGIVAGVYGGATLATELELTIERYIPALAGYAYPISYGLVVIGVTYLSVTVGELAPKRLALAFPEKIAVALAPLLRLTLTLLSPFVTLLEKSTAMVLKLIPVDIPAEQEVTEDDVRSLIEEGGEQGAIESDEIEILSRALKLGDRPVRSIMTARVDMVWIDLEDSVDDIRSKIVAAPHSQFPACRGDPDHFVGILSAKTLAAWQAGGSRGPLGELVQQPTKVLSSMSILDALSAFRRDKRHFGIVISEHGTIDGIVTAHDVLEAVVGELPENPSVPPQVREREDGSLIVDGWIDIEELAEYLELPLESLRGDGSFRSIGGLVVWKLSKIPAEGDLIIVDKYKIEVLDMDHHRVDKLLITPLDRVPETASRRPVRRSPLRFVLHPPVKHERRDNRARENPHDRNENP